MKGGREEQGGMMKGIGTHPESICCFLCSLQRNAIGMGDSDMKRKISLFLVCINFPFIVF